MTNVHVFKAAQARRAYFLEFFLDFFVFDFVFDFVFFFAFTPPPPSPRKQSLAYGQRATGTHPTGMHSCYKYKMLCKASFTPMVLFKKIEVAAHKNSDVTIHVNEP